MLYADHAATTPLRPQALDAMRPFLDDVFGNPSGFHRVSQKAKNALEEARATAAELIGARHPAEVVFTGGGTESNNLALKGAALASGGGVVTTAVEHDAVLATTRFLHSQGHAGTIVRVDEDGVVVADEVVAAVDASTAVVSVMAANNETGVVQPVSKVAAAVHGMRPDVLVHSDAVQVFVSLGVDVDELGVDMLTLAAHKFGGPKGVGLLFVRDGVELDPLLHGGGQELGRRSGTHNVAAIAGMVAAMKAAEADRRRLAGEVAAARDRLQQGLRDGVPDAEFTAVGADRLPQHCHFRIPGVAAENLLIKLDEDGIAAAAGSACHSGALTPSHVLSAMGWPEAACGEAVRISFGWTTRPEDGDVIAAAVAAAADGLR